MPGRVAGKVALVTGGAQGLGAATAMLLAREGASVVVTDIGDTRGEAVAKSICDGGGRALFVHHDVTSEKAWTDTIGAATDAYGKLSVLVNNAGIAVQKNVVETSYEEWQRLMRINLDGVFLGMKYAIPVIAKSGGGSIVNLSSIEGLVGHPDLAAYNASKGGVRILSKSAALYCGKAGIGVRVNSVHPAFVRTPLLDEYFDAQPDRKAAEAALIAAHPIGALGEPDDIAYGVLYLASDESKWVTGTELVIDGGFTAQ